MDSLEALVYMVIGAYFLITYRSSGERAARSWAYTVRKRPRRVADEQVQISRGIVFFGGLFLLLYGAEKVLEIVFGFSLF
jgi:hypothetical protein